VLISARTAYPNGASEKYNASVGMTRMSRQILRKVEG
jgi:hypothetical protein